MIYACSHGVWQIQLTLSYIILHSVIERDIVVLNFNYSASIDLIIIWWESFANWQSPQETALLPNDKSHSVIW